MTELIIGGARSGKSALAEQRAAACGLEVIYIATARPWNGGPDPEMERRIAHHRARRPAHWGLVEEGLDLADALSHHASPGRCLLVDCLTLWLTNLIYAGEAARQAEAGLAVDCPLLRGRVESLAQVLPTLPGHVILVSNEVGWGIVPMHPVSRLFSDEQGRLNQRMGAVCHRATLVAAGLPVALK